MLTLAGKLITVIRYKQNTDKQNGKYSGRKITASFVDR
jgi:hypothetical protein